MRTVLGIDAAWTLAKPSGVALLIEERNSWRLAHIETSYARFEALPSAPRPLTERPIGSVPDASRLLGAAAILSGRSVDLVAIDMPMSKTPITKRRPADDRISASYGARWASTHTPSAERPGSISDRIRESLEALGYSLLLEPPLSKGLIEVYPHPALIELTNAPRRLPYKESKIRDYWPDDTPAERRAKLCAEWERILEALGPEIDGLEALRLPPVDARGHSLKSFEDALDAVICAWVGACALEGRAQPYGDASAAIWVPKPYPFGRRSGALS